jgi:hypothetical protein
MQKLEEFEPEEFLLDKLQEIPATDLLIFTLGAYLGTRGWTPISAMINIAKGISGAEIRLPGYTVSGGPAFIIRTIAGLIGVDLNAPGTTKEEIADTIAKAALGALEAYALTRPGTVGGILQGIGAIVPL